MIKKKKQQLYLMFLQKRKQWILVLILFIIVLLALVLLKCAFNIASSSANDTFSDSLKQQKEETYQMFYQTSYGIAEEKYHVANKVNISVAELREEALLEVLQVSGIEYVYNEGNTKIWTAIRGYGVYVVDLSLSEFVVDNERQYVLVRVPYPQLSSEGLDYEYENYLFEDGIFNGSISDGVDLAMNDLKKAQNQLHAKLASSQTYYDSAEKSAEVIITQLVKNLNPEVMGLNVEVEFVE